MTTHATTTLTLTVSVSSASVRFLQAGGSADAQTALKSTSDLTGIVGRPTPARLPTTRPSSALM